MIDLHYLTRKQFNLSYDIFQIKSTSTSYLCRNLIWTIRLCNKLQLKSLFQGNIMNEIGMSTNLKSFCMVTVNGLDWIRLSTSDKVPDRT